MARTKFVETWDVATGKQQSLEPQTLSFLADNGWWNKPEVTTCLEAGWNGVWYERRSTGGHSVERYKKGTEVERHQWWAYLRPLADWGPGVEVFALTDSKCRKRTGDLMRRVVVHGRSPDVADSDWVNQPPPHEWRTPEYQQPCARAKRYRSSVRLRTGLKGDLEVEMPGDRLVVPVHTSVVDAMVLEPIRGQRLDTPGRMLFNGQYRRKTQYDPLTGEAVKQSGTGPFGFTGELWQLGWIGEPEHLNKVGGVAVLVAVTTELWAPAWAYVK